MPQQNIFKTVIIVAVVVMFGYFTLPSIQFNRLSEEEKDALKIENPAKYQKLFRQSIKLGLDLQGGMRLVMEVDVPGFLKGLAQNKDDRFMRALKAATADAQHADVNIVDALDRRLKEENVDISLYFSRRDLRTREDVIKYLKEQTEESIDRALEVLRNRVDEFGVSEPIIQKQGSSRIVVELAGISDRRQAIDLVGKTAKLEFAMLKEPEVAQRVVSRINEYLMGQATTRDTTKEENQLKEDEAPKDTSVVSAEELFGTAEEASDTGAIDTGAVAKATDVLQEGEPLFLLDTRGIFILKSREPLFQRIVKDPEVKRIIDQESGRARLLLSTTSFQAGEQGDSYVEVFLVDSIAQLTGETIVDSRPSLGSADDPASIGRFETQITFNDEGARAFSRITGANVGKRMAIILDNRVRSAPSIRDKIRNGRARITGLESMDEAKVLSSVLKAGALPAPLRIIEERTVGPSLGADSIRQGAYSTFVGLFLVAIFMVVYYKFSGLVANIALLLNIIILMGFMSRLHATLTLPGIAGIILTIGMAVDANVLIFERIREELDRGKAVWTAIETGYSRAFITIMDANITTLIAAVVLYNFGSGPIKGFATTLMIGIVASMFTAIFVTRAIFEFMLSKKYLKRLSI